MIGNIFNICLSIFFIIYIVRFIKKTKFFSIIMILHIFFSVWLVLSVAFIEAGVYNVDLLINTYFNFSTMRLLVYELLFFEVLLFWYKHSKISTLMSNSLLIKFHKEKEHQLILVLVGLYVVYELLNMLVSENSITNSNVTRFNFFKEYSVLPFAQVMFYFIQPISLLLGCVFAYSRKKKRRLISFVLLLLLLLSSYGTGNEFGVLFYLVIYFCVPNVVTIFSSIDWGNTKLWFNKLIAQYKYVFVVGFLAIVVASLVKIHSFSTFNIYSSYVSSPVAALFYRAFALQGDVWWAVDKKVISGYNGIEHIFGEIAGFFGDPLETQTGIYYLMNLIMPKSRYNNYIWGNATLTAGYPAINIALFGYIGGAIVVLFEASLFFWVTKYVFTKLIKKQYLRLFLVEFIYIQLLKVYNIGGYGFLGNKIPLIFLCGLILVEWFSHSNNFDKRG